MVAIRSVVKDTEKQTELRIVETDRSNDKSYPPHFGFQPGDYVRLNQRMFDMTDHLEKALADRDFDPRPEPTKDSTGRRDLSQTSVPGSNIEHTGKMLQIRMSCDLRRIDPEASPS